ncbi:MAG TPA: hypothetical protein VFZ00_11875 [Solirubrobacter sp.]|nr:hypothetical protein [Solirubrobacter sp.]
MPAAAQAHPCATTWSLSTATFLSANDANTAWAGSLPAASNDADCAPVEASAATLNATAISGVDGPGLPEGADFNYTSNMTPLGHTLRVPPSPTSLADINSDMAFKGNYMFQGHWSGFRVIDVSDPTNPVQVYNTEDCRHTSGQGDVVVHGNILVRTWDSPATGSQAGATCGGEPVGTGFEGIHIWNIADPTNPVYVRKLRMASSGNDEGAPNGCGAHTATGVPDDARGYLYLYVGGSSGTCSGIDIVRIKQSDPNDAVYLRRAGHGRGNNACHDNNVLMNVRGTSIGYAMCAGGNGLAMYKFDMSKPADEAGTPESPGGVENPTLIWTRSVTGVSIGHSGSFTYDGRLLIYGHEPGGGTGAQCQATSSVVNRSLFFIDPETGEQKGVMIHPRPQTNRENCTWHNFNVVPTYKGYYAVSGNYQSGVSVIDFTNPAAPQEIAYADPAPLSTTQNITGGDWSTHFYNGKIYESDIRRGVIIWDLDHDAMRRVRTPDMSNPQTQTMSFEQDLEGPSIEIAQPLDGGQFKQGQQQIADFSCSDNDSGVESCVGTVADGEAIDTSKIGVHTFEVTAMDKAGTETTKSVTYVVNSTDQESTPGATVEATLAFSLGTAPTFGALTPGVANTYNASTTATVVSTAGDGLLTVSDPDTTNTGKLVNGTFTLANPIMASASSAAGTGSAPAAVGGSANPTSLLTYSGPTSNDNVTLSFSQTVGANEALRTGTYSKTLTFTLSTTQP